ncbi:hypothetical protein BKA80DRAFT_342268 [Phyllosticta citrichinensis]
MLSLNPFSESTFSTATVFSKSQKQSIAVCEPIAGAIGQSIPSASSLGFKDRTPRSRLANYRDGLCRNKWTSSACGCFRNPDFVSGAAFSSVSPTSSTQWTRSLLISTEREKSQVQLFRSEKSRRTVRTACVLKCDRQPATSDHRSPPEDSGSEHGSGYNAV